MEEAVKASATKYTLYCCECMGKLIETDEYVGKCIAVLKQISEKQENTERNDRRFRE